MLADKLKKFMFVSISLNVLIGLSLSIAAFLCQLNGVTLFVLICGFVFLSFWGVAFINFLIIFFIWRKYKYWSVLPFLISVLFMPLGAYGATLGHEIGIHNTPADPNSFFSEKNTNELTVIAESLLKDANEKNVERLQKSLNTYDISLRNLNTCENTVEVGYYRARNWYIYIFAKTELSPIYASEPILTKCDISDWGDLVSIIKSENNPSKYNRSNIVFEPEITYPFLISKLDKNFVDKLKRLPPNRDLDDFLSKHKDLPILTAINKHMHDYSDLIAGQLTMEEKLQTINALNSFTQEFRQLLQDENVFLEKSSLEFQKGRSLYLSREATKHLLKLVSDGIITAKDNRGHLRVKNNLSLTEERELKWLQIEIMDHLFGNLVHKVQYSSTGKRRLSDHWYFYTY